MRRKTFDRILSTVGAVMTVVLLVAGGLLTWASGFVGDQVHDQLAAQNVFFPPAGSPALDPEEYPDLQEFAGQQVLDGRQAQAYADGFIGRHLKGIADGKTYSEVSSEAQANPDDPALKGQQEALFRGETLRGLLLTVYAFWQIGQIAFWASIAAYVGAAVLLVLTILGYRHLRSVPEAAEI